MKLAALLASLLFLHAALSAQTNPNFSGEWILDPDRSDFGGSNLVMRTKKVTQSATEFRVDWDETVRVSATATETQSNSKSLRFGQVTRQTLFGAPEPAEIGIRFESVPGLTQLVIIAMMQSTTVMTESWSISSDGKELHVRESFPTANKRRDLFFYRKSGQPRPVTPAISGTWVLDTKRSRRVGEAKMFPSMRMQIELTWKRFFLQQDVWFETPGTTGSPKPIRLDLSHSGRTPVSVLGEERLFDVSNTGEKVFLTEYKTKPDQTYSQTTFELLDGGKTLKVTRGYFGSKRSDELYLTKN